MQEICSSSPNDFFGLYLCDVRYEDRRAAEEVLSVVGSPEASNSPTKIICRAHILTYIIRLGVLLLIVPILKAYSRTTRKQTHSVNSPRATETFCFGFIRRKIARVLKCQTHHTHILFCCRASLCSTVNCAYVYGSIHQSNRPEPGVGSEKTILLNYH